MEIARKALLAAVTASCVITILASCYLALSYTTLKGVGDGHSLIPLAFVAGQGVLTLIALRPAVAGFAIDVFAWLGALGIAWLGCSMVKRTVSSPHFEGYAVMLGTMVVLQGALTLALLSWAIARPQK
jgi:hypothetical protein